MTVSLTTRLGITRWSSDDDPWSREQFDADNAALEALAIIGTQGTNAARPAAGVQRRLYLATDSERVYIDDGDEWYELLVAGVAPASSVVFTPAGDVASTNVQAAIAELAAEKAALTDLTGKADLSGATFTGTVISGNNKVATKNETGTAAPTSGTWAVADKVWATNPGAVGSIGWVCTTAGSPGTWKPWGAVTTP